MLCMFYSLAFWLCVCLLQRITEICSPLTPPEGDREVDTRYHFKAMTSLGPVIDDCDH